MPHLRLRLTRLSLSSHRMICIFWRQWVERGSLHGFCRSGTRNAPNWRATFLCCSCCKCFCCNWRAACAASALPAALLGRRLSCLACYPHRRPRRPPPAKCRGNEVGAKMTGSSSDFSSRTCASTAVPRKLAFGACSRGSLCAWATTTSSTPRAATKEQRR